MADYYAYDHNLPCRNPNCKSHGRPHPNCKCYGGGPESEAYAKGGSVCAENRAHLPGCEYFQDGGMAEPIRPAHPGAAIGHAAIPNGLLGIFKSIGKPSMQEPEKHHGFLNEARDQHAYRKNPTGVPLKRTAGNRLADHILDGDHDGAAEIMHGHPLVGGAPKASVKAIVARLGPSMLDREPDAMGLRGSSEYLADAIRGHDNLSGHVKGLIGTGKAEPIKIDVKEREQLKSMLDEFEETPEKLLDVGGKVGHYLPDHAAEIGAMSARAVEYLGALKPRPIPSGPLEDPQEPTADAKQNYDRQIDIAQKPMLVLNYAKNGTLMDQDVMTVKTIYPALYQSMVEKVGDAVIEARAGKKRIPYKERVGFSLLLGQPIDGTMLPENMQAIMQSAGNQQAQQQQKDAQMHSVHAKKNNTAVALKEIDKANSLSETRLDKRQINRKS